jgi:two-component system OmpR family sensor kinase
VLLGGSLAVIGTGIAAALAVLGIASSATTDHMARLFSLTAGALFLGAGVLRLARWRIVRDSRSLLMGASLTVFGGLSIPLTSLADLMIREDATSHFRAATAISTTLVSIVLIARAVTAPEQHQPRALPVLAGSCLATLALFGTVLAAHVLTPELLRSTMVDPPLIRGTVLAVAWFTLAYLAALGSHERPWAANLAPLLACMCVSELLRINQAFLPGGWRLACVVLIAIVAVFTAHRALLDLDETTKWEHAQLEQARTALSQSQAGMNAYQAWQEELAHDVRNALAGLRAALHTLQQYEDQLDGVTAEQLRRAAMGEVGHLEDMIIRRPTRKPVDFDVVEAIRCTVETRRAAGLHIEMHDYSCKVHGHPGDLATAVQNVLVNSQQHAPGARVRICAVPAGERVHLYIADDGPGLTQEQATAIFERGSRGQASNGSGLGLFVARTLMRQQGGDVELRGHFRGAVFVLTLPAAKGVVASADIELPGERVASVAQCEPVGAAI